ncbi:hypothetical protein B0H13DRAFT_2419583 [Mycena leptocephala]|nr:hypothetical protein B0H13DRAFT_2419583 [Mycena leptocephala]
MSNSDQFSPFLWFTAGRSEGTLCSWSESEVFGIIAMVGDADAGCRRIDGRGRQSKADRINAAEFRKHLRRMRVKYEVGGRGDVDENNDQCRDEEEQDGRSRAAQKRTQKKKQPRKKMKQKKKYADRAPEHRKTNPHFLDKQAGTKERKKERKHKRSSLLIEDPNEMKESSPSSQAKLEERREKEGRRYLAIICVVRFAPIRARLASGRDGDEAGGDTEADARDRTIVPPYALRLASHPGAMAQALVTRKSRWDGRRGAGVHASMVGPVPRWNAIESHRDSKESAGKGITRGHGCGLQMREMQASLMISGGCSERVNKKSSICDAMWMGVEALGSLSRADPSRSTKPKAPERRMPATSQPSKHVKHPAVWLHHSIHH